MRGCRADRWSNEMLRHQADVAHAYQVLKKGGIPDERIVRFSHALIACCTWQSCTSTWLLKVGAACGCRSRDYFALPNIGGLRNNFPYGIDCINIAPLTAGKASAHFLTYGGKLILLLCCEIFVSRSVQVVMMYDDVALDPNNPHPGKLFNRPGGPDVYEGMHIDYTGDAVNAEAFLQVLLGAQVMIVCLLSSLRNSVRRFVLVIRISLLPVHLFKFARPERKFNHWIMRTHLNVAKCTPKATIRHGHLSEML